MISAFVQLLRFGNMLIAGASVVAGAVLAARMEALTNSTVWLAALSAALVAGGGNALNDFYDVEIDRINRPKRPLPSGKLRPHTALAAGVALMLSGTGLGFALNSDLGLLALIVSVLLWGYCHYLKQTPLAGNVVVALCAALTLAYGATAAGNPIKALLPMAFAFLVHLGREIVKTIEDVAGDKAAGARTLPIVIGQVNAGRVAAATMTLLAVLTPLPYLVRMLGVWYLALVIPLATLPLLWQAWGLWRGQDAKELADTSRALKLIMVGGLAALYVG